VFVQLALAGFGKVFRTLAAGVDDGGHGHSERFRDASPTLPSFRNLGCIAPENAPGHRKRSDFTLSGVRWYADSLIYGIGYVEKLIAIATYKL
jgi:hypothetical protein